MAPDVNARDTVMTSLLVAKRTSTTWAKRFVILDWRLDNHRQVALGVQN